MIEPFAKLVKIFLVPNYFCKKQQQQQQQKINLYIYIHIYIRVAKSPLDTSIQM